MVCEQSRLQGFIIASYFCMAFVKSIGSPGAYGEFLSRIGAIVHDIIYIKMAILASYCTQVDTRPSYMPMPEGCYQTHVLDRWCVGGILDGRWYDSKKDETGSIKLSPFLGSRARAPSLALFEVENGARARANPF